MKKLILGIFILIIAACNSNTTTSKITDSTAVVKTEPAPTAAPGTSASGIIEHYLHIKNALAKDDGKDAANGSAALAEAFTKFDASGLTAEQKKTYDDLAADAKEHAEHIGKNAGKVEHQREHFAMLSKDVYDLVKITGAGQTLYQDFCPMYNNNKGATWLSEKKEISNPYLGSKMPDCGSVKETLQ